MKLSEIAAALNQWQNTHGDLTIDVFVKDKPLDDPGETKLLKLDWHGLIDGLKHFEGLGASEAILLV